jgi:hypothetical protein
MREEIGLLLGAGDLHTLEGAVKLYVDVEVTGILMKMKERPGPAREVAAPSFTQLGELAEPRQQCFKAIKVFLRRVPHVPSMTLNIRERKR